MVEDYPITDRAEFDKKYATIEGEDNRVMDKLLQEARHVNGGDYWVKAIPKKVSYRDRKFPWAKHTYTDYSYIFYMVIHNGAGEEYISGYEWEYEKLKWYFIGLSSGYCSAKKVGLAYNEETKKVEEVPWKE